jgi:hypothetical protein
MSTTTSVPAGRGAHAPLGQPDGADEVGERGDVLADSPARLVHRAGAGDEQCDAAEPQPGDRAGDEVVVQPQAESGGRGIGANAAATG